MRPAVRRWHADFISCLRLRADVHSAQIEFSFGGCPMGNHHSGIARGELLNCRPTLSEDKRSAVRRQLEAILADPLFKHSKRCSDFLRFAVLRVLDETTEAIKERTLGVELFGRQPDYDTNVDPVVRVTAAEVRKRLHHYYQTFGRDSEIRIEFPRGSYVPEFSLPQNSGRSGHENGHIHLPTSDLKKWFLRLLVAAPYGVLCVFLLGATHQNTLERFWSPVSNTKQVVTLCVKAKDLQSDPIAPGDTAALEARQKAMRVMGRPSHVALSDSIALSMIGAAVRSTGAPVQFRVASEINLEDLKEGPIVSIGVYGNHWTEEFQGGRFGFSSADNSLHYIVDNRNPSSRAWAVDDRNGQSNVDYGLLSRMANPTTGTYFVAIGGIHGFGTEAAALCAADVKCLDSAARLAPGDWKRANLQIVVQTNVIDQKPGVPRVMAAYLW